MQLFYVQYPQYGLQRLWTHRQTLPETMSEVRFKQHRLPYAYHRIYETDKQLLGAPAGRSRKKVLRETRISKRKGGMLKYADYDIVFQEIPDEVTLAINLSNCPHHCPGCHSPYLQRNTGKELNRTTLSGLLRMYGKSVTCVCFMGGGCRFRRSVRLGLFCPGRVERKTKNSLVFRMQYSTGQFLHPVFRFHQVRSLYPIVGRLAPKNNQPTIV